MHADYPQRGSIFHADPHLEGLIREQAACFPVTAAYVGRALRLVPPSDNVRPADYALTPDEWLQRFAFDRRGQFDAARATSAFAAQLGPRWTGPGAAPPAARFLFAVLGLHLAQHREEALALVGAASVALGSIRDDLEFGPERPLQLPDPLVAQADVLLTDPVAFEEASVVAAGHAYTATALMGLLNAARRRAGVLAPAQFAWLKLVDRPLWYALHSLGYESEGIGRYLHPNPRVEAAGARDHWAVEQIAGRPVVRPSVERAVEAIRRVAAQEPGRCSV